MIAFGMFENRQDTKHPQVQTGHPGLELNVQSLQFRGALVAHIIGLSSAQ